MPSARELGRLKDILSIDVWMENAICSCTLIGQWSIISIPAAMIPVLCKPVVGSYNEQKSLCICYKALLRVWRKPWSQALRTDVSLMLIMHLVWDLFSSCENTSDSHLWIWGPNLRTDLDLKRSPQKKITEKKIMHRTTFVRDIIRLRACWELQPCHAALHHSKVSHAEAEAFSDEQHIMKTRCLVITWNCLVQKHQ